MLIFLIATSNQGFCGYWEKLSIAVEKGHNLSPFMKKTVRLKGMERSYPDVLVQEKHFYKIRRKVMGSSFTTSSGRRQEIGEFLSTSACPGCEGKRCFAGPVSFLKTNRRWGITSITLENTPYHQVMEMCRTGKIKCGFIGRR